MILYPEKILKKRAIGALWCVTKSDLFVILNVFIIKIY